MKVAVYDKKGEKKKDLDIKSEVLNTKPKELVLRDVVVATLAAKRNAHPKTKKVGDVAGSGIKPWRQKGTGRARTGSRQNPIWRGGGNIFGPVGNENHTKKVNKKVKKQSLYMALTSKDKANEIIVLDGIDIKEPKTKEIAKILEKLPAEGKKLIVIEEKSEALRKSVRNIKNVEVVEYRSLNAYIILKAKSIVFVNKALDKTVDYFGKQKTVNLPTPKGSGRASSKQLTDKKKERK